MSDIEDVTAVHYEVEWRQGPEYGWMFLFDPQTFMPKTWQNEVQAREVMEDEKAAKPQYEFRLVRIETTQARTEV